MRLRLWSLSTKLLVSCTRRDERIKKCWPSKKRLALVTDPLMTMLCDILAINELWCRGDCWRYNLYCKIAVCRLIWWSIGVKLQSCLFIFSARQLFSSTSHFYLDVLLLLKFTINASIYSVLSSVFLNVSSVYWHNKRMFLTLLLPNGPFDFRERTTPHAVRILR